MGHTIFGWVFADNTYTSDTVLGTSASASMVLRSGSSHDEFLFALVDYDPSTNNATAFAYAYVGSPGNSKSIYNFNFTDSSRTINAGHRLALVIYVSISLVGRMMAEYTVIKELIILRGFPYLKEFLPLHPTPLPPVSEVAVVLFRRRVRSW